MKAEILVDNIKCEGCVQTIKKGLELFPELSEVNIDMKKGLVTINSSDGSSLERIKKKLSEMGYPAKNTLKGFDKLTADARSFLDFGKDKKIQNKKT